jgi:hypothetical protein
VSATAKKSSHTPAMTTTNHALICNLSIAINSASIIIWSTTMEQQMRGDFGNHTNSKSFLNQLILVLSAPNSIQSGFITTISGLPNFSSEFSQGGDPQQQW